jgi:hypothetical protein
VTFDATQSTGDGLSFVIDFDDGTFANTAVARHVFMTVARADDRAELRTVRAFVVDRFGRVASEARPIRLITILTNSVTTNFLNVQNSGTDRQEIRKLNFLQQDGTQLTGTYQHPQGWTKPLTATLSGANHIHVRLDDGSIDMDGTYTYQSPVPNPFFPDWLILSVRGGPDNGAVLPFNYHDCC